MKKLILTSSLVLLTGCFGYTPMYRVHPATESNHLADVTVGQVLMKEVDRNVGQRRVAQLVTQKLEQHLRGEGVDSLSLEVTIEETTSALAVRADAVEQRLALNLNAQLRLLDADGKKVYENWVATSSTYNVEDSPFGTDSGKVRAREFAADRLSEEIVERIGLYLHQENTAN